MGRYASRNQLAPKIAGHDLGRPAERAVKQRSEEQQAQNGQIFVATECCH